MCTEKSVADVLSGRLVFFSKSDLGGIGGSILPLATATIHTSSGVMALDSVPGHDHHYTPLNIPIVGLTLQPAA